jgi:hypothetical protein
MAIPSVPKTVSPTTENVRRLDEELTSVMAGHPGALEPST